MKSNQIMPWRWSALAVNIAAITLMYLYHSQSSAFNPVEVKTLSPIQSRYGLITWFAVYGCLLVYNAYVLFPSQRHYRFYDGVAMVMIVYLLLTIIWIFRLSGDKPGFQLMINFLLFLTALLASKTMNVVVHERNRPRLLFIPFILNLGWVSVLVILNAVTLFRLISFS
jgi:hypothetical protein